MDGEKYSEIICFDNKLTFAKPTTFPFYTGSFTVYNDKGNKKWRIKAYAGARHTFNAKHTEKWPAVVDMIRQLTNEANA